jgi:predicted lactoylglutathione lyase
LAVPCRISLVTLGVTDLAVATAFYESLGWRRSSASVEGSVTFFNTEGPVFSLFGRGPLAEDAGLDLDEGAAASDGFRSVALAVNLDSPAAVDQAVRSWASAGGRVVRAPEAVFWGGYRGYVADLYGHLWEFAHNPGFTRGTVTVERAPD